MSSRALRKLQQQQELEAEKARAKSREDNKDDDEEEDSEEHPAIGAGSHRGARAKMPRNPFDLVSISRMCNLPHANDVGLMSEVFQRNMLLINFVALFTAKQ